MEINIPPKADDPQRLIALNGVDKKFWLSASEINQMVNVLAYLLGNRSSLYLGEFDSLYDLEQAHPDPDPGSYAQIIVEDPNQANKKAEWDNTKKIWVVTGDYDYPTPGGSTQPITRLDSLSVGWVEGYEYIPRTFFHVEDIAYTDSRKFTLVPHATLDKVCTFAVNIETKKLEILEGDPAENPVELQDIDYNKYLVGPFVIVKGGSAQPDNVVKRNVYQENAGTAGGEWDVVNPGPDYDVANGDDPAVGALAIKVIGEIVASQLIRFNAGEDIPVTEGKQFALQIKNITQGGDFYVRIRGKRRGGRLDSFVLPEVKDYGYDPNNTQDYQLILLPVSTQQLESFYEVSVVSRVAGWKYLLDDIFFSGGEAIPDTGTNNYVTFQDLQNYALSDLSNLVSTLSVAQQNEIKTKLGIVEGGTGGITNAAQIIDLGDILTDTIEDAFNDDALAASITITAGEYTVLKAIQNGKNREWLFVGKPDTYEGSATLAIADDFFIGKESPVEGGYTPPSDYNTVTELLNGQGSQVENEEYTVKDASGWSTITHSGWATFKKKATNTASESDYELREQEDFDSDTGIYEGNVWRPEIDETNTAQQNADLINAAILAAEPVNGSVILPAGDFDIRTINYDPKVRLRGQGTNATILRITNAEPGIIYSDTTLNSFVHISDFTLYGGVDSGNKIGTIGIQLNACGQIRLRDIKIENFVNNGISLSGVLTGNFDQVYIRNTATGIKAVSGNSNYGTLKPNLLVFRGCTFSNCSTWGVEWAGGTSIHFDKGCNFEYLGTSGNANTGVIKFDSTGAYSTDQFGLTVEGSWFEQNNGTVFKITSHVATVKHRIASSMVNSGSISNVIELNQGELMVSECDFKTYTSNLVNGTMETRNVTHGVVSLQNSSKHKRNNSRTGLTGTEFDLGCIHGDSYNFGAASSATAYTYKNLVEGGFASGLVNAASEPTVTGATKISGETFVANTNMELVVEVKNGAARYFFLAV